MRRILGIKLKKARGDLVLTQEALASAVGLSTKYISHLELGRRTPSLETLTKLSEYLKRDISYFFEEKERAFNTLLKGERLDKKAKIRLRKFQRYCEEYVNLEELTGHRLELAPLYTNVSAERMTEEERQRLGLGNEPIRDIFPLLEMNGCRIVRQFIPEPSNITGAFIFLETKEAAFALINSSQSPDQQAFIAAHEYCHYLKDRREDPIIDNPDIFVDEFVSLYHPREKFAQTFASRFLMPPSKVEAIIDKEIRSARLKFNDVIFLKRYFGVSILSMMNTLKELGYLSRSKYEEYCKLDLDRYEDYLFRSPTLARRQERNKGKIIPSDRFKSLAIKAYQRKKINAEKLSKLLNQEKSRLLSTIRE